MCFYTIRSHVKFVYPHRHQDTDLFHHQRRTPSYYSIIFVPTPSQCCFSPPVTTVLRLYSFIISRMLYKCNRTACNLLRLVFPPLSMMPFRSIQVVVSIVCFFSLLSSIPLYGCTNGCLTIHPLRDFWVVSSLGLFQIMLLYMYRLCVNIGFYFSGINAKSVIPGAYAKCIFSFLRSQTIFPECLYQFIFSPVMYD